MVPPLSDVKAACQQCHATDLMARAQVYATMLKVDLGGATTPAATSNAIAPTTPPDKSNAAPTAQPASASAPVAPVAAEIVVNDPNTVDYVQRYNEIVLGQRPVNYGNIALVVLVGLVAVGGGGFVIFNELKIRSTHAATKQVEGEYPAEVVDMLPALAKLKYQSRQSLRNLLKHPDKADKVLGVIDTLVSDEKTEE